MDPNSKRLFEETPVDLRRLVLLLYGLVLPPFLGVLAVTAEPSRRLPSVLAVLAICALAAGYVGIRRTPTPADWIFPVGVAPTVSCGLAFAAGRGSVLGFVAVMAAPLAWSAVLCSGPTVMAAWVTGILTFLLAQRAGGSSWLGALGSAGLFGLVGGLVAWVLYGKTVHHREARLRHLERRLNDIELLTQSDGVIVDANDRAVEAYGYPREELVGASLGRLQAAEDPPSLLVQLREIEERGGKVYEAEHVRRDGSRFPVEVSARIYGFGGRRYVHALVRDISARRAAESQRRFVETLFAHLQEAVVVLDEVFRVKIWSKGAERIFGWTEAEVLGRSPFEFLIPPNNEASTAMAITRAAAGEENTHLMRRCRKDGSEIICSVNIVAVQDGTGAINGVMGVGRDVTAQNAAEAALRESEERLKVALSEAQQATLAREQILAVVAHDLRNPLAAIACTAHDLPGILSQPDARAEIEECAELIGSATARMGRLIEDLLDTAAIQNGRLRLAFDAHDSLALLSDAIQGASPQAERAGVTLDLAADSPGPKVHCDRGRILQVLLNLLSNALHATPGGGIVTVGLSAAEDGLCFSVKDKGRGLEEGQADRLFQPYQRGASSRYKGAGLGLAIARGIVEGHGGRIWAESPTEGGTAFHFVLPASAALPSKG